MTERDLEILLHKAFTYGGMYAIHSDRGDEARTNNAHSFFKLLILEALQSLKEKK